MNWLVHVLGLDDASGSWYLFWSGFGSNALDVAILGGAFSLYQSKTCDIRRCYRLARYPVKDTEWTICRHHAPNPRPTVQDLAAQPDVAEEDLPPNPEHS